MGKIIAICNQKGGTGKTTSAINLSTYLALAGKKVLLVDLDPQGNATSGVGIEKNKIQKNTYHLMLEETPSQEIIVKTEVNNLFVAPATLDLTGAEVELVGMLGRENRLRKALLPEKDNFDFIVIDCPPSFGLLTINALCAANSVFIPLQCEYYALEGLSQLLRTIGLVRDNLNPDLEIEGVFLTMADYRTNLTHEVINEARNYFSSQTTQLGQFGNKVRVYETVIPRNIRLTEAPSFCKPIALYDGNSIGAQKYQELSQELLAVSGKSNIKVANGY